MSDKELLAMKEFFSKKAENNSLLFMWTSGPFMEFAIRLGQHWGFKYVTVAFVWDKVVMNPGNYTLTQTEFCLVFKRGKIPTPRGTKNERQLLREKRTAHSRKPSEVRTRIARMFPTQNKLEMFARSTHKGWDAHGNETRKFN